MCFPLLWVLIRPPFRCVSSNFALHCLGWPLFVDIIFGYLVNSNVRSPFLVSSALKVFLQFFTYGGPSLVAFIMVVTLVTCQRWPVNRSTVASLTLGYEHFVSAIAESNEMLRRIAGRAPEFQRCYLMAELVERLHEYWQQARDEEHPLTGALEVRFQRLLAEYRRYRECTILPHPGLESRLGKLKRRADAREKALILMRPKKRAVLLKLFALRQFLGHRKLKFVKEKAKEEPVEVKAARFGDLIDGENENGGKSSGIGSGDAAMEDDDDESPFLSVGPAVQKSRKKYSDLRKSSPEDETAPAGDDADLLKPNLRSASAVSDASDDLMKAPSEDFLSLRMSGSGSPISDYGDVPGAVGDSSSVPERPLKDADLPALLQRRGDLTKAVQERERLVASGRGPGKTLTVGDIEGDYALSRLVRELAVVRDELTVRSGNVALPPYVAPLSLSLIDGFASSKRATVPSKEEWDEDEEEELLTGGVRDGDADEPNKLAEASLSPPPSGVTIPKEIEPLSEMTREALKVADASGTVDKSLMSAIGQRWAEKIAEFERDHKAKTGEAPSREAKMSAGVWSWYLLYKRVQGKLV